MDAFLAADADTLTAHDMASEATWAYAYRGAGHRETAQRHFVDIEIDHPDEDAACFGHPAQGPTAATGPAQDCIVDKIDAFAAELRNTATSAPERLLALKYLLHFVGDLHQPLHASDNHDRGGNCVQVSLGGVRSTNLHSYWDTAVVQSLGDDPQTVADELRKQITPKDLAAWRSGTPRSWAMEAFGVGQAVVYRIGSRPGCDPGRAPISLPTGYAEQAQAAAARQLEAAGVRWRGF